MAKMKPTRQFLGVFWDIQNVNIPKGMFPPAICQKIRDLNFCKGNYLLHSMLILKL